MQDPTATQGSIRCDVDADLAMVIESHAGLYAWLDSVGGVDPTEATDLPGWSVGHVMTHLARNADSLSGILESAGRGEVGVQYPGGIGQRNGDIEDGAARTWPELVADVITACHRLDATFGAASADVWNDAVADVSSGRVEVAELPFRRTREVEVHRLDLGLGATPDDWSPRWVTREWEVSVPALPSRLPDGVAVRLAPHDDDPVTVGDGDPPIEVRGSRAELLGWVIGRADLPGAPPLAPWP
ncbi:MAG TPA: maleylpyruvate isomerase family mycothiol-dependent enzyme [Microthrixaceae bacterium]|nr:maleylpyruvate isomerase family mycothiol-dependent enzyme [Microthrixaceae bacterium]